MKEIGWGILGTGKIASRFAEALLLVPDARLVAVASRSEERAEAFARSSGALRSYGDEADLLKDSEVQIVYIASPHTAHAEQTIRCLQAGKHVLCEKPFALNEREAQAMVDVARRCGLFLMEAMWTRFIPLFRRSIELIREGAIGRPVMLLADFGFRADFPPSHRLYDPALGGGALLDIGVYPVHVASVLWGEPSSVTGNAVLGPTGVDVQGGAVLTYPGGEMAVIYTSLEVDTPIEAVVMGEEGRIHLHHRMHHPTRATLTLPAGEQRIEIPFEGNGLQFEATEATRCVRHGLTESETMPLNETLGVMRTLDRLRDLWGVLYPGEVR